MRSESIRKIVETSILVALATAIDLLFELNMSAFRNVLNENKDEN